MTKCVDMSLLSSSCSSAVVELQAHKSSSLLHSLPVRLQRPSQLFSAPALLDELQYALRPLLVSLVDCYLVITPQAAINLLRNEGE